MTNIQSGYLKTKNGVQLMTTVPYPIGAIYLSIDSTNPTKLFGGTWQQIAQGRTLVGVDTSDIDFNIVEKTGGEKTHTLTVAEMPSHTHGSKLLSGYFDIRGCGTKGKDYSTINVDGIITRTSKINEIITNISAYFFSKLIFILLPKNIAKNPINTYRACFFK